MHQMRVKTNSIVTLLAGVLGVFASAPETRAADLCGALWQARNAIFANKGYCFETSEAVALFGKGCFPPYGKLSAAEEADVQRIRDVEAHQGCSPNPVRTGGGDSTSASDGVRVLPKYVVQVSLSSAAANKLTSSGETVRVSASYYGTAASGVGAGDDGEIGLANETLDLANGTNSVNLGGISIPESELRKTKEGRPMLLINVYTSRKVFQENLLDCGIYQGDAALAGQVDISCKLIGER
ncbi:YARHG domain-containing protein [Hyphomicrobium sp.]|uniref:YARHG domain-containing protein n=1 Tax=Hyphomicrobium sp. TaxID=82 RepID=UPI000FA0E98D|nr:YARHG domain-containing protein [Hyphomicrobium sp.]RUP00038.1 MAG: YARHG domain-containing protein [Hyphomicrobium sp.]